MQLSLSFVAQFKLCDQSHHILPIVGGPDRRNLSCVPARYIQKERLRKGGLCGRGSVLRCGFDLSGKAFDCTRMLQKGSNPISFCRQSGHAVM